MRVAVLGAGSIGCALGGLLALRGAASVQFVARGAQLEALARRGLTLDLADGPRTLPVEASDRLAPGADLVLAATQTQDLGAALAAHRDAIGPATVVTLQNGLAAEDIAARVVPPEQVVGGVTVVRATFQEPGRVEVGDVGGVVLGRARGPADRRVHDAAAGFAAAGVPVRRSDNLAGARWTKLAVNSNNALAAALGRSVQECFAHPRVPPVAARLVQETLAVARAEGATLEALPWTSPWLLRLMAALPPALAGGVLARRARRVFSAPVVPSTLQTLRRGKPTEVDFLNGAVVARGRARGVPTPVNAAVLRAVKAIEAGGPFLAPDALVARVAP